jgi:hypothetical protein
MSTDNATDTTNIDRLLAVIAEATGYLDAREPAGPTERIRRWQAAAAVLDNLSVVVGQMAADALDAMHQLGRLEASTDLGPVHIGKGYAKDEWRGYELLGVLAERVVHPDTGEVVEAVPVEVLRDVIPACSDPEHTSSKWKATALKARGINVRQFREQHDAPDVIRRGERGPW